MPGAVAVATPDQRGSRGPWLGPVSPAPRPPATPLTCGPGRPRYSTCLGFPGSLPPKSESVWEPARATPLPRPPPRPRRSFARAHREPGREREMSFPAARWRCQLIGRGRGPRAGLGASLAAAGAQLSGKNWGGRCGEISYRSLGGAAGPRSALTAADPGPARRAGAGRRGQGCWGWGGLPRPLPSLSVSPRRSSTSSSSPHPPPGLSASLLSPLPFIPPPWYRPKADPELTGILRPQHWPPRLGLAPGALSEC